MSEHILLVCGSLKEESLTRFALQTVERFLLDKEYTTSILNVGDLNLPIFDPDQVKLPVGAQSWIEQIELASGLVIGTPEYHGGFSGAIKNAIDYTKTELWKDKPIALIAAAGGYRTGINSLNGLRLIFRNVYARTINEQAVCSKYDLEEDEDGDVDFNEVMLGQLYRVAEGLLREMQFARQLGLIRSDFSLANRER
ncbi:NAD(P)H-dependent oxidoreductase [Paenibacillus sp. PR3]|uniref:NAD(P)H-dependent oxidoreductase n=1 Tax=Paenibacillus terricola TaxID=2763503 RepID=A0ABR8MSW5_9BACL|nr:NAD(P)H-dependent oxidoreductase [Paenibacillus terricola]MBD3919061.1 NAD(P)H-dependent oxidoreductase [Paenibacillus terricola]